MKITFLTLLHVPNGWLLTEFHTFHLHGDSIPSLFAIALSVTTTSLSLSLSLPPPPLQIALTHALRDNLAVDQFRYFAISTGRRPPLLHGSRPPPPLNAEGRLSRPHRAYRSENKPDYTRSASRITYLSPSIAKRFSNSIEWSRDNRSSEVVYLSPCIQTDRPIVAPVCT